MTEITEEKELERNYLPIENYIFDWNMMLYSENENESEIDWNKLIYNDEQLLEFELKKNEKKMKPEFYEYLFKKSNERSEMEKFYLRESGFDIYDYDSEESDAVIKEEERIKRFIIKPNFEEEPSVSLSGR